MYVAVVVGATAHDSKRNVVRVKIKPECFARKLSEGLLYNRLVF